MKNKILIIALFAILFLSTDLFAEGKWMTRATMPVNEPGLVETIVPPELHRTPSQKNLNSLIELSLVGPDGNFRAFELFWRAAGEAATVNLKAEKTTLLDDRRILWETSLAKGFSYSSLKVTVAGTNFTGKVDFEGLLNGQWSMLATGTLLDSQASAGEAAITFPEAQYEKFRCYFTGFDEYFKQTPVFVKSVEATAKQIGSDFVRSVLTPQIEQVSIEDGIEARIFLPGSGLRIDSIELYTSAQFSGSWQLGSENIVLGKREFQAVDSGKITALGNERQKLVISYPKVWDKRVLLVRMRSDNFFGKIEQVKVNVMLPRMMFVADQAGEYCLQNGHDRPASILDKPVAARNPDNVLEFNLAVYNSEWQAESLLKSYSGKGAPFQADGFKWKAAFAIDKPGFYQLLTTDKISLDRYRDSLRIVKDETQVPYFLGGAELRELDIRVENSYDAANNRTIYLIKLPEDSSRLAALRFKAKGIFNRTLKFEKHEPGQISWQSWQTRSWINQFDAETAFTIGLSDFPEDQFEIRLIIEHASNQPIEITEFKGLYSAQDLFFIANEPGLFNLMGGNPSVRAPVYDLAMVEEGLSELSPVRVKPGVIETVNIETAETTDPVDQGAPFNDAGYTWIATFSVPVSGFFQLGLNLKASLDGNPSGLRLVRNGMQVPYFFGSLSEFSLSPKFSAEYTRNDNTTICVVELPVASKQWQSLQFSSAGVFSRNVTLEIRKPGKLGWKHFASATWTGRSDGLTTQAMRLDRLPEGETELRLVIPHGDNSPISITAVNAYYQSRSILFQANEAGEYKIYGGNSSAKAPKYDLALIKDNMLKKEPQRLQLGESADFSGSSQVRKQLGEAFSDRGWGIYAVLGLVTALLLIVIVKLFPEDKKQDQPPAE